VAPGISLPGRGGVRIEDIVGVTDDGAELCNTAPTDLIVLD
jgi:Xaa-Pro aminopeptidase